MNKLYHNAPVFSQLLLVVVGMSFILNIFGHGFCYSFLSLDPDRVFKNFELWRILSYPLSSFDTASFLLLSLSLGIFASHLEITFSTKRFALSAGALVLSFGLLYSLVSLSLNQHYVLSGGDVLSFFIISLFAFLQPQRSIVLLQRYEIRAIHVILVLAASALTYRVIAFATQGVNGLYYGLLPSIYGLCFGLVVTTLLQQQLKRVRAMNLTSHREILDDSLLEQEEELVSSFGKNDRNMSKLFYPDPQRSDEEMLNLLLDKIIDHGQESLTPEEKSFLEDYSQRMR